MKKEKILFAGLIFVALVLGAALVSCNIGGHIDGGNIAGGLDQTNPGGGVAPAAPPVVGPPPPAALAVSPSSITIDNTGGGATGTFTISGGEAPYVLMWSGTDITIGGTSPQTVAAAGIVTVTAVSDTTGIVVTITDDDGDTKTVTVIVENT